VIEPARYRLWQFWKLLSRRISPDETAEVRGWLAPPLFEVFSRLNPSEQHHAYQVRRTLMACGVEDPDLLTAALLHDAGKSRMPLAIWEKAAIVLGGRLAPAATGAWGRRGEPVTWWTRPFVNARQHPAWGADLAAAAGAPPAVVALIRRHQDKIGPDDPLYARLSALQSADDSN
jgi:hypothetical protein